MFSSANGNRKFRSVHFTSHKKQATFCLDFFSGVSRHFPFREMHLGKELHFPNSTSPHAQTRVKDGSRWIPFFTFFSSLAIPGECEETITNHPPQKSNLRAHAA
jgi:hypothetical protein